MTLFGAMQAVVCEAGRVACGEAPRQEERRAVRSRSWVRRALGYARRCQRLAARLVWVQATTYTPSGSASASGRK